MSERVDLDAYDDLHKVKPDGLNIWWRVYTGMADELRELRAQKQAAHEWDGESKRLEAENARLRAECDARQGQLSKIQQKYRQYWNEQARAAYEKAKDDD